VRSEAEYFADIPDITLPDEMLRVAEHILETKTADFDPAYLEDRYRTVLVSMLREKHADLSDKISAPASPSNVINLMDTLKRSLAAERTSAQKQTPRRRAAAAKPSPSKSHNANARARKPG
jgi:DNA end-binding protein Ku